MMNDYPRRLKVLGIETSTIELDNILKAWLAISFAFGLLLNNGSFLSYKFISAFAFAAVTVGIGFIAHELSHKLVAQRYGYFAEFRANFPMLLLAIVMSFLGFLFAAPGAVVIFSRRRAIDSKRNGKISAAGPLANITIALLFLPFVFSSVSWLHSIGSYGFMINGYLSLFNMLPFAMFDGAKVLKWNKIIYASMAAVSVILVMLNGYLPI